jgi:hypothetical protein
VSIIRIEQINGEIWHIVVSSSLAGRGRLFILERETAPGQAPRPDDDGGCFTSLEEAEKELHARKERMSKGRR